ncbi:MAG: 50S ribosomal protein L23 [Candidatus Colwellbacteria bacterium]|nr:50S ribosomal protein L23 [Candidatus Colwellbacteria bacterium]MBI3273989.1 50S ribosomal protein L23 [Candidatus Colwellbacteria bacterium]
MQPNNLLIKKPWISEKATDLAEFGKYVFSVVPAAGSNQIKKAIENIYGVHVVKVNILNKVSLGHKTKKAVVTLRKGEKIDIVPH